MPAWPVVAVLVTMQPVPSRTTELDLLLHVRQRSMEKTCLHHSIVVVSLLMVLVIEALVVAFVVVVELVVAFQLVTVHVHSGAFVQTLALVAIQLNCLVSNNVGMHIVDEHVGSLVSLSCDHQHSKCVGVELSNSKVCPTQQFALCW